MIRSYSETRYGVTAVVLESMLSAGGWGVPDQHSPRVKMPIIFDLLL